LNGANSLDEELKTPLYPCPVCLNKLDYLFDLNIKERYAIKSFF